MNFTSHLAETGLSYESAVWLTAESVPGVRFGVARISLGRRIALARRIREIGRKIEFLKAGTGALEALEAAVLEAEIDHAYLEWGLVGIEGLQIDGVPATSALLLERGPVTLAVEILAHIKSECGLREDERKN